MKIYDSWVSLTPFSLSSAFCGGSFRACKKGWGYCFMFSFDCFQHFCFSDRFLMSPDTQSLCLSDFKGIFWVSFCDWMLWKIYILFLFLSSSFFFLFFFLAMPITCGSSWARDPTHVTAVTRTSPFAALSLAWPLVAFPLVGIVWSRTRFGTLVLEMEQDMALVLGYFRV